MIDAAYYNRIREEICDRIVEKIPQNMELIHDYTNECIAIEKTIREAMQSLPSEEFEGVLHPVFEADEIKLILVGAALGVAVGFLQYYFVF